MEELILTRRRLPEREQIVSHRGMTYEVWYELVAQTDGIWPFKVYVYRAKLGAFVDEAVESRDFVETVLRDSAALPSGVSYLRYRNALHVL